MMYKRPIEEGTKVDLPLWLAMALAQREIVELKNPSYLTQKYYNTLKAGSEVVTLSVQSPYLIENVMKICSLIAEEDAKEALEVF